MNFQWFIHKCADVWKLIWNMLIKIRGFKKSVSIRGYWAGPPWWRCGCYSVISLSDRKVLAWSPYSFACLWWFLQPSCCIISLILWYSPSWLPPSRNSPYLSPHLRDYEFLVNMSRDSWRRSPLFLCCRTRASIFSAFSSRASPCKCIELLWAWCYCSEWKDLPPLNAAIAKSTFPDSDNLFNSHRFHQDTASTWSY